MPAGRPTNKVRHPALLAARLKEYADEVQKMDDDELEHLRGWQNFNPNEKKWLALIPYYRSPTETSRALGLSDVYHQVRMQKNPYFKKAYKERQWTSVKIARYMALDMLGMGIISHMNAIMPDNPEKVDNKTRFEYIRLLYQVTGMAKPPQDFTPGTNNTFINTQNVTATFGSNKEDRPIVDLRAKHVEDAQED